MLKKRGLTRFFTSRCAVDAIFAKCRCGLQNKVEEKRAGEDATEYLVMNEIEIFCMTVKIDTLLVKIKNIRIYENSIIKEEGALFLCKGNGKGRVASDSF
jgi:hypothetical protein